LFWDIFSSFLYYYIVKFDIFGVRQSLLTHMQKQRLLHSRELDDKRSGRSLYSIFIKRNFTMHYAVDDSQFNNDSILPKLYNIKPHFSTKTDDWTCPKI